MVVSVVSLVVARWCLGCEAGNTLHSLQLTTSWARAEAGNSDHHHGAALVSDHPGEASVSPLLSVSQFNISLTQETPGRPQSRTIKVLTLISRHYCTAGSTLYRQQDVVCFKC